MNFKNIHIGELIEIKVKEKEISMERILAFFKIDDEDIIQDMYKAKYLSTADILKWSKLLKYDFFRLYSQHLILYKPQDNVGLTLKNKKVEKKSKLPEFKKQLYTREIIDFILELIEDKKKTPQQVVKTYNIPETTLYRWIKKYGAKVEKFK